MNYCDGRLVYFKGKTPKILNSDQSKVSTDGITILSGWRPVSKFSPMDISLPKGVTTSSKSEYSAIYW